MNGVLKARCFENLLPRNFHFAKGGHVGHRAARSQIRQDHRLLVRSEDIGRFGHEMHPTEHDVFRRGIRCFLAQHERITEEICVHHDAVSLIVVAENQEVVAKFVAKFSNPVGNCLLFHGQRRVHEINRAHGEGDTHGAHSCPTANPFSRNGWR